MGAKLSSNTEDYLEAISIEKFTKFVEFVRTRPEEGIPDWLRSFGHYFKTGKRLPCRVRIMKRKTSGGEYFFCS